MILADRVNTCAPYDLFCYVVLGDCVRSILEQGGVAGERFLPSKLRDSAIRDCRKVVEGRKKINGLE